MKFTHLWVVALFVITLFPAAVAAQDNAFGEDIGEMNFQLFRPSVFGGEFLAIDDAQTLTQLGFGFGLYYDYANSLFSYFREEDLQKEAFDFISELHTGHLTLSFGLTDWWSIGGHLPVHYIKYREFVDGHPVEYIDADVQESNLLLGDVMAEMKFRLLRQDKHWLGMALLPLVTFDTADDTYLIGEGRITGGGNLALDHDFGPLNVGLNGGYIFRGANNEILGTEVGDAVTYGAGISHTGKTGLGFSLEYWGRSYAVEKPENLNGNPMELTFVLRWQAPKGPRLLGGGGPGLSYGSGAPSYRLLAGFDYHYRRPDMGVLVVTTLDENGKKTDAGLNVTGKEGAEQKVASAGTWNTETSPGSYTIEANKEGYQPASSSAVVNRGENTEVVIVLVPIPKPKTFLNVLIVDNCTDKPIAAKLKLSDGSNAYATGGKLETEKAPGSYSLEVSAEGYDTKTFTATLEEGQNKPEKLAIQKKIQKTGKVYFASGSHVILAKSYGVLDDVAAQIKSLCNFKEVVIEGHTDSQGNDASNMKLSQRRAQSVKDYLVSRGVDPNVLSIMPYGETQPIGSNETKDGREINRRVEFVIK